MIYTSDNIQPYVEMLIDALENKGASSSGISYNPAVLEYAPYYRTLLESVRQKHINDREMHKHLDALRSDVLMAAGTNQSYRINGILNALDIYFQKEYNKINN
jgi:hypothetical protein